jgi:hypothetical protein
MGRHICRSIRFPSDAKRALWFGSWTVIKGESHWWRVLVEMLYISHISIYGERCLNIYYCILTFVKTKLSAIASNLMVNCSMYLHRYPIHYRYTRSSSFMLVNITQNSSILTISFSVANGSLLYDNWSEGVSHKIYAIMRRNRFRGRRLITWIFNSDGISGYIFGGRWNIKCTNYIVGSIG